MYDLTIRIFIVCILFGILFFISISEIEKVNKKLDNISKIIKEIRKEQLDIRERAEKVQKDLLRF